MSIKSETTMTVEAGARLPWDKRDDWQKNARDYRITLHYNGKEMSFDYWQGTGIKDGPQKDDVIYSIVSDWEAGNMTFEEFCAELGYDTNSRKAYRTWEACRRMARNVERVFGNIPETDLDEIYNR